MQGPRRLPRDGVTCAEMRPEGVVFWAPWQTHRTLPTDTVGLTSVVIAIFNRARLVGLMNVAVLDIGKTNVKFVVFDPSGEMLFERQTKNEVINTPPYPHFDVDSIWRFLGASLREATAKFKIETLVPTTHGASGAVMNDDGLALPIIDYEFSGIEAVSVKYNQLRDPFSKTFSPSLTVGLNWGRQLAYQAWYFSTEFSAATKIIPIRNIGRGD